MRFGSVCSGIEAASVAWHPLGWRASFLSEIEAFPRAVLAHHYPDVPLHGDFTTIKAGQYEPIELLVGGTPCQSFSVAGLRGGLDDERGNLALEYLRLADRLRPRWLVWENVPGVLSSNGGRDFGAILGGMVELGYGFAYRVLDAQFAGVPQRRRRVFVVGCLGDWRGAAAVLFERHSLQGHSPPRRQAGKVAPTIPLRSSAGGGLGTDFDCDGGLIVPQVVGTMSSAGGTARKHGHGWGQQDFENGYVIPTTAHSLRAEGFDASEDGTGRGTPLVPVAFQSSQSGVREVETHATLDANNGSRRHNGVAMGSAVRRLTPRECERLQGFPDDYTAIPYRGKPAADGPRYKALGNSMAVLVMAWIGERIAMVDGMTFQQRAAAE